MEYRAKEGSRLDDDQAQRYGDRLETLKDESGGSLTAALVLGDAQDPASATHDWFEWDDVLAAHQYRLNEARYLLRSIMIEVETDGQVFETRAFVHVTVEEDTNGCERHPVFVTVQRAMTEDDLRLQVIEEALRQLQSWRKRYEQYQELADVFAVADAVQAKLIPAEAG